jgi:hypothetical protein
MLNDIPGWAAPVADQKSNDAWYSEVVGVPLAYGPSGAL